MLQISECQFFTGQHYVARYYRICSVVRGKLTHAVLFALQRADMSVHAASEKVAAAQQLVPALPGIDPALVACMRKGLFVNIFSGALSQCAILH